MSLGDPPIDGEPRATYYADARSWAQDAQGQRDRSRRLAWVVAAVAITIAALEALALLALAPLKTVVPYTLLVDRNTGFVEALDPTRPLAIRPQVALTRSMLAQYVVARETFAVSGLAEQYQKVALWSAQDARRDYLAMMAPGNPDGPLSRYPRSAVVQTHIESVSAVAADTALVRFTTEQADPDQGPRPRAYWAAMVRYRWSGEPMALADRLVNPLGFQVVSYRRDQEAPPPDAVAPVASAASAASSGIALHPVPPLPAGASGATTAPGQVVPAYPRPPTRASRAPVIQTL